MEEGSIIYFDPFYFKNGNTAKPKYFIVLRNIGGQRILASLPTRKDSIPTERMIDSGCIELPDINFNCFVLDSYQVITSCGKSFDFRTHIYGHQIDEYDPSVLKEIYPIENTDYFIWGNMKEDLFRDLIKCLKFSKTVKRKFKRLL